MPGLMRRSSELVDEVHHRCCHSVELMAALQCPHERDLVRVLEIATDRDATRDPRNRRRPVTSDAAQR